MTAAGFDPQGACWICGTRDLTRVHDLVFELSEYRTQDPELAAYTGSRLGLLRCRGCGFAQPEALPTLPRYFSRVYDQRWPEGWVAREYEAEYKDEIFDGILRALSGRLDCSRRRLLDIGAHAGRFITLARRAGWLAEGLELNPTTAAYAAQRTGARVRAVNVSDASVERGSYDAVTMTDVLEHIPQPIPILAQAAGVLAPGGWIAVKVPSGPGQLCKETWRGRLRAGYRPTVADNLVHVNHFSPLALRLALERAGFSRITIQAGRPELPESAGLGACLARSSRRAIYVAARTIPGAVHTPLALNLQAYACRA